MNASSSSACARIARTAGVRLRGRLAGALHIGFDELTEPDARGRLAAELPEGGPRVVIHGDAGDTRPNLP
jgi:hypothetical protein